MSLARIRMPGEARRGELVEGRVLSTGRTRSMLYLNFGRSWSTDFTVTIPAAAADRFAAAGMAVEGLAGRRVRVRGWLGQHDGPTMHVEHPEQIELLDR